MGYDKGDTNRNFTTILFVIFLFIFSFAFSGKSNNLISDASVHSVQSELIIGYNSNNADAISPNVVHLPVFLKNCGYAVHSSNLNIFNLQYKISGYNRRIIQNIILFQKVRLSIKPEPACCFCCHLNLREKEDIPVLS
jgi:hypothetical protein